MEAGDVYSMKHDQYDKLILDRRCYDTQCNHLPGSRVTDGAHGANGADTTGANGEGVDVDGARGVGARGANVDWGVNMDWGVRAVDGARGEVNGAV